MIILQIAAIMLGLISILRFAQSMKHFQVTNNGSKFGKRYISMMGTLTLIIISTSWIQGLEENVFVLCVSAAISLAGVILFQWSIAQSKMGTLSFAGTSEATKSLIETGPYRFVRHPIYLSYVLGWVGLSLTGRYAGIVSAVYFSAIYILMAHHEEEQFIQDGDNLSYRSYRERTGMFIPKLK